MIAGAPPVRTPVSSIDQLYVGPVGEEVRLVDVRGKGTVLVGLGPDDMLLLAGRLAQAARHQIDGREQPPPQKG